MASTTIGGLIGWGLGAYGKRPKVPNLREISPDATQAATVKGNIKNFADIAALATQVNTFNQDQLDALIDRALPGARQQIQETLTSQLRGEIPQDVQNAIYRGTAERGVAGGFGGSQFNRNVTARDLGLTSLEITNKALSSTESWLAKATAPQFDVTSMFFTPQQRLAFEQQQQSVQFQRDVMAAGVAAAPDPAMAAIAQGIDQDIARVENAALSMAGMGFGGGGGSGGTSAMSGATAGASFGLQAAPATKPGAFSGGGLGGQWGFQ